MGSIVGKVMQESMAKQQEQMVLQQRIMLERNIQMQNYMREQMMAMQLAKSRDVFVWFSSFYGITAVGLTVGFIKTRKPGFIAPLIPLSFVEAYQYDMAVGNKMERLQAEANRILAHETSLVALPQGLPTVDLLDSRRLPSK